MQWEPARADHSIDRALVSIKLWHPIDPDLFDELAVAGRRAASSYSLTHRIETVDPIEVQAIEGVDGPRAQIQLDRLPAANPRRVHFQRREPDGGIAYEFAIGRNLITFATLRYRRWADFEELMTGIWNKIVDAGLMAVPVKAVRLEYRDRWTSAPGGGDHFEVIAKSSTNLTGAVSGKSNALHVHSGWFDFINDTTRQLTNVTMLYAQDINIGASTDDRRKIRITTLREHEALTGPLDNPLGRLHQIHDDLKKLYESTITPEAAHRVKLV